MVSDLHAMFIEHDEDFLLLASEHDEDFLLLASENGAVACWSMSRMKISCYWQVRMMQSPAIGQY